jgi:hypothetical protein
VVIIASTPAPTATVRRSRGRRRCSVRSDVGRPRSWCATCALADAMSATTCRCALVAAGSPTTGAHPRWLAAFGCLRAALLWGSHSRRPAEPRVVRECAALPPWRQLRSTAARQVTVRSIGASNRRGHARASVRNQSRAASVNPLHLVFQSRSSSHKRNGSGADHRRPSSAASSSGVADRGAADRHCMNSG